MSIISRSSSDIEILSVNPNIIIEFKPEIRKRQQPTLINIAERLQAGADARLSEEPRGASNDALPNPKDEDLPIERKKLAWRPKWTSRNIKIGVLLCLWIIFTILLLVEHVHDAQSSYYICVTSHEEKIFTIPEKVKFSTFFVDVRGPFIVLKPSEANQQDADELYMEMRHKIGGQFVKAAPMWIVYLNEISLFDTSENIQRNHIFKFDNSDEKERTIQLRLWTNVDVPVSLELRYEVAPMDLSTGIVLSFLLFGGLFVLLVLDMVHRALSIILVTTLAIGILAVMELRPPIRTIVSWINFEVLLLIFSFMIIIAILSETGALDYVTMKLYKYCNGHIWPMVNFLCLAIFLGSCFLDSILMILLVVPIGLRVCEILELNPVPLLTCLMISGNIGAALAPNGETPNDYVTKNVFLREEGVDELVFLAHVAPGVIIAAATAYIFMRIKYKDKNSMRFKNSAEYERLRRAVKLWERTAKSITVYSRYDQAMRETVLGKVHHLKSQLDRLGKMPPRASTYEETLRELEDQFTITNKTKLIKTIVALLFALALFVTHLFPDLHYVSTAWTTLLACLLLLVLAVRDDFDSILGRMEWSSMLFLGCFLVFTQAINTMGLFDGITSFTVDVILKTPAKSRLLVAIIMIVWISAVFASFLTDTVVGAAMLRAVIVVVNEADDKLPIQPLLWAVVLGTGLGGIGTIIGKYSNVVCASLAEKHGYHFPFLYYSKVAFPIMILCVLTNMCYLLLAHLVMQWH